MFVLVAIVFTVVLIFILCLTLILLFYLLSFVGVVVLAYDLFLTSILAWDSYVRLSYPKIQNQT